MLKLHFSMSTKYDGNEKKAKIKTFIQTVHPKIKCFPVTRPAFGRYRIVWWSPEFWPHQLQKCLPSLTNNGTSWNLACGV